MGDPMGTWGPYAWKSSKKWWWEQPWIFQEFAVKNHVFFWNKTLSFHPCLKIVLNQILQTPTDRLQHANEQMHHRSNHVNPCKTSIRMDWFSSDPFSSPPTLRPLRLDVPRIAHRGFAPACWRKTAPRQVIRELPSRWHSQKTWSDMMWNDGCVVNAGKTKRSSGLATLVVWDLLDLLGPFLETHKSMVLEEPWRSLPKLRPQLQAPCASSPWTPHWLLFGSQPGYLPSPGTQKQQTTPETDSLQKATAETAATATPTNIPQADGFTYKRWCTTKLPDFKNAHSRRKQMEMVQLQLQPPAAAVRNQLIATLKKNRTVNLPQCSQGL